MENNKPKIVQKFVTTDSAEFEDRILAERHQHALDIVEPHIAGFADQVKAFQSRRDKANDATIKAFLIEWHEYLVQNALIPEVPLAEFKRETEGTFDPAAKAPAGGA